MLMRPTLDIAFKKIFGNEKKPEILIGFLNAVMECPLDNRIEQVTIKNPNNDKDFKEESYSILDIKAETNRQELINIEIQVAPDESMIKRSLYYGSRMITGQKKPSQNNYNTLKDIVCIIIMDFELEELMDEPFHCTCHFTSNQTKRVITSAWVTHYIQLPKLGQGDIVREKEIWFDFLKHPEKYVSNSMLKQGHEPLSSAVDELKRLSLDENEIELYLAREKQLMDYESQMACAVSEGLKRGMQQGLEQGLEKGLEKGLEQGMEQGLKKGLEDGRLSSQIEMVYRALQKGRSKEFIIEEYEVSEEIYEKALCSFSKENSK